MESFWARLHNPSGQPGPDYWTYFAERIAHLAAIPNGAMVLDIGADDGNVLFKAMQKIEAQGYGVGIDIDSSGFPAGVAEAKRRGWKDKIAFAQMDANALGFRSNIFDTVLTNFVGWDDWFDFELMKFKSPNKVALEILRVLKPGGQVGIGSWVAQSDIDWIVAAFKKYLPECVKASGKKIICYSKEHPEGQQIVLRKGGFENIRVYREMTDFVSPDADTWWEQMKRAAREYFMLVSDPWMLEDFRKQVFADLRPFTCPEGIRFSKTVSFAFGTKPV